MAETTKTSWRCHGVRAVSGKGAIPTVSVPGDHRSTVLIESGPLALTPLGLVRDY